MAKFARNATAKGRLMPALLLLLSACASIPEAVRTLPDDVSVELAETPFFPQERYQCGPAALATSLVASGANAKIDDIVDAVYLPGRKGSLQLELVAAARRYDRLPYIVDGTLAAVQSELTAGRPVLVLQNLGVAAIPRWHYAVVVGIDAANSEVILRSGTDRRRVTPIDTFLRTWRRSDYWGLVLLRPEELPARPDRKRYFATITALEEIGRTEAAAVAWRTAASRWPGDRVALFGMANAEFSSGRMSVAEVAYRKLLDADPGFAAARNNLALLLAELGRFDEARTQIAAAQARNDDPEIARELQDTALQIERMVLRGR